MQKEREYLYEGKMKQPQLEPLSRQRKSSIGRILEKGDNFIQGKKMGRLRVMDEKGRVQTGWGDK